MSELLIQPLGPGDPQHLGPHQLIGLLGHGGMGRVYLGVAPGGSQVAVKVMHPQFAGDTAFRERFRREADVAQRVSGPFTARVLDSGVDERIPWLATEYIPGPTLAQLVTEFGPLPGASVRALAAGLAQALSDIHSRWIVHRDLKPANVILSVTGPRVIDFGIARALDGIGLTATDQLLGTINYMSPEQLTGQDVTGASDVYSLGGVLIYASTGKTPQQSLPGAGPAGPGSSPGLGDVPPGLRALIARCLRHDPVQRATLGEIIRECGHTGIPRLGDWLPPPAAALIQTRIEQQRGKVTTLLNARRAAPRPPASVNARPVAPPQPARPAPPRATVAQRYRAMSARMALASDRWPLVRQASLRRWSRLSLLLVVVTLAEVTSRTALAQRRGPAAFRWLVAARDLQGTITQFTSWLPDPLAAWSSAGSAVTSMAGRLAVFACALLAVTAVARRTRRTRAHKIIIKAAACYLAVIMLAFAALRLVQTGFGPLLHIAAYLRWWTLPGVVATAALMRPLAGPAR